MSIVDLAVIDITGANEEIVNVQSFNDFDVEFFKQVWPSFFPDQRVQPISELLPDDGVGSVWLGWMKNEDGLWFKPPLEVSE